eukprot:CAMPEP_0198296808 /NCGR_PEP_ID=MMETSP1449-20131203/34101_1 /TAXON_ID=420275 /ORGANISM="Attheya septentrionalis, Strain CCMP2084" /LENGTH=143 /DNA_ID=CAMNT_0043997531 /DNA_START=144 /DNA_END=575 /DNA_ORIENTATION=+
MMVLVVLLCTSSVTCGFAVTPTPTTRSFTVSKSTLSMSSSPPDESNEIVARKIIVSGAAVMGGYYRSCVLNEASRFRKLIGTMSPPDDTDQAEIYVEGKRKMVDGFIRWCKRGNVGLSQVTTVTEVIDEIPTGLYDDFYVRTR